MKILVSKRNQKLLLSLKMYRKSQPPPPPSLNLPIPKEKYRKKSVAILPPEEAVFQSKRQSHSQLKMTLKRAEEVLGSISEGCPIFPRQMLIHTCPFSALLSLQTSPLPKCPSCAGKGSVA